MCNNIYFPKLLALADNGVLFGKICAVLGVVVFVIAVIFYFVKGKKHKPKTMTAINFVDSDDENAISYVGGKKPNIFIRFLKFINPFSERAKNRRYDRRREKERRYTQ